MEEDFGYTNIEIMMWKIISDIFAGMNMIWSFYILSLEERYGTLNLGKLGVKNQDMSCKKNYLL